MDKTRKNLDKLAFLWLGLIVCSWSPGDGKTRYAFFPHELRPLEEHDYYHTDHVGVALGLKEAWIMLESLKSGYNLRHRRTSEEHEQGKRDTNRYGKEQHE